MLPPGLSCSQTDAFAVNRRLKTLASALAFRNMLSVALILCPTCGEVETIHLEDSRHLAQVPAPGGSRATRRAVSAMPNTMARTAPPTINAAQFVGRPLKGTGGNG